MNSAKKTLIAAAPLMKCGNLVEFKQRLQWLSEGMLRNHLESVINCTQDQAEMALYKQYKLGNEVEVQEELK